MKGWRACLLGLLALTGTVGVLAQQSPMPVPGPVAGSEPPAQTNTRLILKDGSYQLVRQYHVEGDRVVYVSVERGQREELPTEMVDWAATARWSVDHGSVDHGAGSRADSPGMKAAAELDRERAEEREEEAARMPEIAPGLRLPDLEALFVVDQFEKKIEAVEIPQTTGTGSFSAHAVVRSEPGLLSARRHTISLPGGAAKVRAHQGAVTFYLGLPEKEDATAPDGALTVDTHGASSAAPKEASAAESKFVLVKVEERVGERRIPAQLLQLTEAITADHPSVAALHAAEERVWPLEMSQLKGGHWIELQFSGELVPGEYALIEVLKDGTANLALWDFAIDPKAPENARAIEGVLPNAN